MKACDFFLRPADNAVLRPDSCRSQQTEGILLLLPKYRTQQVEPPSHPSFALPISVMSGSQRQLTLISVHFSHISSCTVIYIPTLIISGLPSNEASDLPSPAIITHLHPRIENVHQPAPEIRYLRRIDCNDNIDRIKQSLTEAKIRIDDCFIEQTVSQEHFKGQFKFVLIILLNQKCAASVLKSDPTLTWKFARKQPMISKSPKTAPITPHAARETNLANSTR